MIIILIIILLYILLTTSTIILLSKIKKIKRDVVVSFDKLPYIENINKIPYIIHLTYNKPEVIPKKVWVQYQKFAPEYNIQFYDDKKCEYFIKTYFNPLVLQKFKSLKHGAHKADLFRYCILYIYGGIYLDIKSQIEVPIANIIDHRENNTLYTCISATTYRNILSYNSIYQGFIATYPRNPLFFGSNCTYC